MARLREGVDVCPCQDTGDCGSACPCIDEPQLTLKRAEDNVDGLPLHADHIVPLSISDRRHVVSDLSSLRLVLGSCKTSRGDGAGARRVDRDGYPMQRAKPKPRPPAPPAPPPLSPISDAVLPPDLPRWRDADPWPTFR